MINMKKAMKQAIVSSESEIRTEFAELITQSGWPTTVKSKVSLVFNELDVGVSYPSDLEKTLDNLEYGNIGVAPTWTLRKIDEMIETILGKRIDKLISKELVDFTMEGDD
jgi:hypothetical protein